MADMTDPVLLIVYALAIARITGLVTVDDLTDPIRDRLIGWLDYRPGTLGFWIGKLITCQWCASIWVATALVPLLWFHHLNPIVFAVALILAFSQVTGMMSDQGR